MTPISRFFKFNHHNKDYSIHYLDWGHRQSPVVICAHGLTRNARDFNYLAREIVDHHRVIAIDFPGRGLSDWLDDKNDYVLPVYIDVIKKLRRELNIGAFDWIGTSMGGIIGMLLAFEHADSLKRLIINDVGPEVPSQAARRIIAYLEQTREFDSEDDFNDHIREIYAPFGPLTDEQWQHLADHSKTINRQHKIVARHDPGIVVPFRQGVSAHHDLWAIWQSIDTPLYLIYGVNSDILLPAIMAKMKRLQPSMITESVAACGHAPALMDTHQIQTISHWLTD